MPLRFAIERETRPDVLREHAMTALDPDFPRKAQGNPHIQGLLGLRGLGLGLVVESIPRGSFRNAINSGLPILPNCPGVTDEVETGETLEVDFITGTFRNVSRGTERQYEPLTPLLLDLVRAGGWEASFRSRLARLREAE
jgi:3-isopropylmalate/(R)-2-methylmalate dehydratase small subunit